MAARYGCFATMTGQRRTFVGRRRNAESIRFASCLRGGCRPRTILHGTVWRICFSTPNAFAGRVAASLLDAIGLPELVTHNIEDYERVALQLAKDPALLDRYRNRLAANRTTQPLFDADRFRRHIEAAYLKMWEIRQCGGQPRAFAVDAEPAALPPIPSLLA
jgi:hypothetical protein